MLTSVQTRKALEQAFRALPKSFGLKLDKVSDAKDADGLPMVIASLMLPQERILSGREFGEVIQVANDALREKGDERFVMISLEAPPSQAGGRKRVA